MREQLMLMGLGAVGLLFRAIAARPALRVEPGWSLPFDLLLSCVGAWMFASAAGLWTPWWPVLPLTVIGSLAVHLVPRQMTRPSVDAVAALCFALLAVPRSAPVTLALVLLYPLHGMLVDRWVRTVRGDRRRVVACGTAAVVAAIGASQLHNQMPAGFPDTAALLSAGISLNDAGDVVRLPSGGALWLQRKRGSSRPALFLHGADSRGARQLAATPLRRALLANGYMVASLDHPGYGASPAPSPSAPLGAWDPLINIREALDALAVMYPGQSILLVGHSLGAKDAVRALRNEKRIRTAVLFGAAVPDPPSADQYWYQRFHSDRGLQQTMAFHQWRELNRTYYDAGAAAESLKPDHAPVVFVTFEHEHADVALGRDALFGMIPGDKRLVPFPGTTHYFNAVDFHRLALADTFAGRRLAAGLAEWLKEPPPEATPGLIARQPHVPRGRPGMTRSRAAQTTR